jgi:predicted DNA-binding protein with PD1-like motif/glutaredoxin
MRVVPIHLEAGSDLRIALEQLAAEQGTSGFVLSVVGNLSRAAFQCPGRPGPSVLEGDLEIITLQGTVAPGGVHLHLSLSDGDCQVWGGHLEPGTLVKSGADLLVGLLQGDLPSTAPTHAAATHAAANHSADAAPPIQPRVELAVLPGCPFSARALRMLRTLGIPHSVTTVASSEQAELIARRSGRPTLPQVFVDGEPIGGYDDLAERHLRGNLEPLRVA